MIHISTFCCAKTIYAVVCQLNTKAFGHSQTLFARIRLIHPTRNASSIDELLLEKTLYTVINQLHAKVFGNAF